MNISTLHQKLAPKKILRKEGERIVDDFLEIGCLLDIEKRRFLIRELDFKSHEIDSIDVHPCFTMSGRLICIVESSALAECWLYYPSQMKIIKRYLRNL